jgi:hypothetical protein
MNGVFSDSVELSEFANLVSAMTSIQKSFNDSKGHQAALGR